MVEKRYILGVDEGTTSVRCVVYDLELKKIIAMAGQEFSQTYPHDGWVSQDAEEIYLALVYTIKKAMNNAKIEPEEVYSLGLTNQRETVVAWDRKTKKPIADAIVWQCRRTEPYIAKLSDAERRLIKDTTGLVADPYFSASKMAWIMKNVPRAKELAKEGRLCLGTMDSFIAFKLTGRFVTDTTNASRTMLFNLKSLDWDANMLKMWGIKREWLAQIVSSGEIIGEIKSIGGIPLASIIGDQQSSLVGNGCLKAGQSKVTYGTGGFVLVNTGEKLVSADKLLSTIAYTIGGKTVYALEGSIYSACSAINWARDNLRLFDRVELTEKMALDVRDNGGLFFVPAFTGLGAPYWNSNARGVFVGINFETNRNHFVRAILESLPLSTAAIVDEMKNANLALSGIKVDGGASKNGFVMQFLADVLGKKVERSYSSECTVLGAVYLAGVACGALRLEDISSLTSSSETFEPNMSAQERKRLISGFDKAIKRSEM